MYTKCIISLRMNLWLLLLCHVVPTPMLQHLSFQMTLICHFCISLFLKANNMATLIGVYLSLSMRELSLPSAFRAAPNSSEMWFMRCRLHQVGSEKKWRYDILENLQVTPVLNYSQDYQKNCLEYLHRIPRIKIPKAIVHINYETKDL